VRDPFPEGGLRHVLVPPTLGHHQTTEIVFTVLSVEIWEHRNCRQHPYESNSGGQAFASDY
jgi:hypothetical protein